MSNADKAALCRAASGLAGSPGFWGGKSGSGNLGWEAGITLRELGRLLTGSDVIAALSPPADFVILDVQNKCMLK